MAIKLDRLPSPIKETVTAAILAVGGLGLIASAQSISDGKLLAGIPVNAPISATIVLFSAFGGWWVGSERVNGSGRQSQPRLLSAGSSAMPIDMFEPHPSMAAAGATAALALVATLDPQEPDQRQTAIEILENIGATTRFIAAKEAHAADLANVDRALYGSEANYAQPPLELPANDQAAIEEVIQQEYQINAQANDQSGQADSVPTLQDWEAPADEDEYDYEYADRSAVANDRNGRYSSADEIRYDPRQVRLEEDEWEGDYSVQVPDTYTPPARSDRARLRTSDIG